MPLNLAVELQLALMISAAVVSEELQLASI
jgi:hypothetical protein